MKTPRRCDYCFGLLKQMRTLNWLIIKLAHAYGSVHQRVYTMTSRNILKIVQIMHRLMLHKRQHLVFITSKKYTTKSYCKVIVR